MTKRDTDTAALLLVNRLVAVDGAKPLTAREYWALLTIVPDPADLLGRTSAELLELGLDTTLAGRVGRLLDASIPYAFERERLESGGLRVISTFDPIFPARLRQRLAAACPAVLLVAGDALEFDSGGLGIVGSRAVSDAGSKVAHDSAVRASERGEAVISGYARGVDQVALEAALGSGGRAVGVPSEGLSKVVCRAETRRHLLDDQLCLLSPYGPASPFSAANAMARNKLVYALADRTLVVASDDGAGGTWEGATEALRRGYGQVVVWLGDGAGSGNAALVRKGATPLFDLEELNRPTEPSGQLRLDADAPGS